MERSRDKIVLKMAKERKKVLILKRKHLSKYIDDSLLELNEISDGLPWIKLNFVEFLNSCGIDIEYSDSSILFLNLGINTKDNIDTSNIVAIVSTDILERLDLKKVSQKLADTDFDSTKFPGIIFKLDKPSATIMIFSDGKMIITGLREKKMIKRVAHVFMAILQNMDIIISNPIITIHNSVSTIDLGVKVDLNAVKIVIDSVKHDPETFPGLIYRIQNPRVEFWIFSDGKIICLGAKSKEHLKKAVIKLIRTFVDFKLFRSIK